jgi:hypothetical protein
MIFGSQITKKMNFGFSEFILTPNPNQQYSDLIPAHTEGRFAIVTSVGLGRDGREWR